ncbi:uncharacterized protein LOC116619619 [Nematostella vectensis]|uniref:uncharacterized protein LOC116619619 n=1 Tax=Nematostella vectensis TaxID=45351 RepID=UPI0020774AE2|nr:uncharacterized protein LOC116619619 [Nematostella vectensis]
MEVFEECTNNESLIMEMWTSYLCEENNLDCDFSFDEIDVQSTDLTGLGDLSTKVDFHSPDISLEKILPTLFEEGLDYGNHLFNLLEQENNGVSGHRRPQNLELQQQIHHVELENKATVLCTGSAMSTHGQVMSQQESHTKVKKHYKKRRKTSFTKKRKKNRCS